MLEDSHENNVIILRSRHFTMTLFLTSHLCSSRASSLLLPHVVQSSSNPPQHTFTELSRGNMRFPGRQLAAALAALSAAVWASQAEVIDDILGSLSRATSFLERHNDQINLDGLVGFVILQGWYCEHGTEWRNLHVCYSIVVVVMSCVVDSSHGDAY